MFKASPAEIKDLMKSTGVGMMECKKALEEAEGDREKAVTILRERGLATQAKKAGRVAAEGIVTAVVEGNVGAVVEVNIETDFAANNDEFKAFVANVAKTVIEKNPADLDALKAMQISGGDKSVEESRISSSRSGRTWLSAVLKDLRAFSFPMFTVRAE